MAENTLYDFYLNHKNNEQAIRKRLVVEDVPPQEAGMFSVYDNYDMFKVPELSEAEMKVDQILKKHQETVPVGTYSICSASQFEKNFNTFSENMLRHLNWDNVIVAGGAVNACLLPVPEGVNLRKYYNDKKYTKSDIDMFIYGLSSRDAEKKMIEIADTIVKSLPVPAICIRSTHAISIVSQYPYRHIQIISKLYKSPLEVLMSFDIDCCAFAYDGTNVLAVPRSAYSMIRRTNVIDMSRRSPSYEFRLQKYTRRGFSVTIPGLEKDRIDMRIYTKKPTHVKGLARLLILEHMDNNVKQNLFNDVLDHHQATMRRNITLNSTYHKSDYSLVYLPWGREHTAQSTCSSMYRKVVDAENLIEEDGNHRICIMGTMQDIIVGRNTNQLMSRTQVPNTNLTEVPEPPEFISDEEENAYYEVYVAGDIRWVTSEGMEMVGSFQKPDEINWYADAYVPTRIDDLCSAIASGNYDLVKSIVSEQSDDERQVLVNARDMSQRSPLALAIRSGDKHMVKFLLDSGASVVARQLGKQALHFIAQYGHSHLMDLIIEHGNAYNKTDEGRKNPFRIDEQDSYKLSPVLYSLIYGHLDCFKNFINKYKVEFGDCVWEFKFDKTKNYNLLKLCMLYKRYDFASFCLEAGYDPHDNYYNNRSGLKGKKLRDFRKSNFPILIDAIYNGDFKFAKLLSDFYYENDIEYRFDEHYNYVSSVLNKLKSDISRSPNRYSVDIMLFFIRLLEYQLPLNVKVGNRLDSSAKDARKVLSEAYGTLYDALIDTGTGDHFDLLVQVVADWNIDFNKHRKNVLPYSVSIVEKLCRVTNSTNKDLVSNRKKTVPSTVTKWHWVDPTTGDTTIGRNYAAIISSNQRRSNVELKDMDSDYNASKIIRYNKCLKIKELLKSLDVEGRYDKANWSFTSANDTATVCYNLVKKVNLLQFKYADGTTVPDQAKYMRLFEAVASVDIETVKSFSDDTFSVTDSLNNTPLSIALRTGNEEMINLVLNIIYEQDDRPSRGLKRYDHVEMTRVKREQIAQKKRKMYVNNLIDDCEDDEEEDDEEEDDEEEELIVPESKSKKSSKKYIKRQNYSDSEEDSDEDYEEIKVNRYEPIESSIYNNVIQEAYTNSVAMNVAMNHRHYGEYFKTLVYTNMHTILCNMISRCDPTAIDIVKDLNELYEKDYVNKSLESSNGLDTWALSMSNAKAYAFVLEVANVACDSLREQLIDGNVEGVLLNRINRITMNRIREFDSVCGNVIKNSEKLLLSNGKNWNELVDYACNFDQFVKPLFNSVEYSKPYFKQLYDRVLDLDFTNRMKLETNAKGQNLLTHAVVHNASYDIIKTLIEGGYDQNNRDVFGNTPLHYAYYNCNIPTIRLLVPHQKENWFRMTPQDYVMQNIKVMVHHNRNENVKANIKSNIIRFGVDVYNNYILGKQLPIREFAEKESIKTAYSYIFDQLGDTVTAMPDSLKL